MQLSLSLKGNAYLTKKDKQELDKQIEDMIQEHSGNSKEINKFVFDSVTALTASESRSSELSEQGMFKRFLGGVTGKNQRIQSEIDNGLARAQYASQQTIQKLAEQNLMSFELITTVNNKLNSSVVEIESEINNIYETLIAFFKYSKSQIIQLENRVDRLEKNVNLLNWVNTIEYQMYNEIEYMELNKIEKIVCLVRDFYDITKGSWTTSELLLLKSALSEMELSPKEDISYKEFIYYVSENKKIYNKLIHDDFEDIASIDFNQISIISGLCKVRLLETSEKYIVNTVKSQLRNYGVDKEDENLRYSIVENYLRETAFININSQVNLFDFIIELLLNISTTEYIVSEMYINSVLDFENMELEKLNKYAQKGNTEAQFNLGMHYCDGECIVQDYNQAVYWFSKAAEQGNTRSQFNLGICFDSGKGVVQDYNQAAQWYNKASEQGDANSQTNLAFYYANGQGVEEDYNQASILWEKAAKQGNSAAQCNLGICYEKGIGVSKDINQALYWYNQAAEQGYEDAQCQLGECYFDGKGVVQDYNQAVEWFRKAAERGYAYGQFALGCCYYNGDGLLKDYDEAAEWFSKAAEQGNAQAQYSLGLYYYEGLGKEKDYKQAVNWYKKAAEQGDAIAQNALGSCFYDGNVVAQDYTQAFYWYKKSAEQGIATAQERLGDCYNLGRGVAQDHQQSSYWYRKNR